MSVRVKRNSTFRADLIFTEEEWAALYPWEAIEAKLGQGARRFPLQVATNAEQRQVTVTLSDPNQWRRTVAGEAAFDVWITRNGLRIPIPAGENMNFTLIDGVAG